jgi:hypothetical protein
MTDRSRKPLKNRNLAKQSLHLLRFPEGLIANECDAHNRKSIKHFVVYKSPPSIPKRTCFYGKISHEIKSMDSHFHLRETQDRRKRFPFKGDSIVNNSSLFNGHLNVIQSSLTSLNSKTPHVSPHMPI